MTLIRSFLLLMIISVCACSKKPGTPTAPNILLIMCDDLGWGDVGFNGNSFVKTPHLDYLAEAGMVLKRFYTASPVCSPTRASCLTGRNPYRQAIYTANTGHLRQEETTIPEILKKEGYVTGHFGKWHLGTLTTKIKDANRGRPGDSTHYSIPSMHGYDTWMVTESKVPTYDPMYKPLAFDSTAGESLRYGWRALETKEYEDYGTKYWTGAEIFENTKLEGDDAQVIMDRVIPFIEDASVRKMPFFSTIWIHTPHLPVVSDLRHRMMYADRSAEDQLYFGTISAMDEQIGRLTDKLVELGIQNNTLIWFCSDNGPERGTPGSSGGFRERKRSLYEGGVRVPAFIYWPDQVEPGQQTNFPLFTSDFLPTLVDLLAIDFHPPVVLDGISVKEALLNGQEVRDKAMGFLFPQKVSLVTQQYKLISTDDGVTFELYDLLHDPQETTNLFESHPEVVKKLKAELETWHSSVMQEYSRVVENQ